MALTQDPAPRNARHFMVWIVTGVIAGLVCFLARMLIDNDEIGNSVVPDVLIGGAIAAIVAVLRRPRRV
ncbi:hypothetical protein SAMN06297144_1765 [Sphingomonas guangdongensis]|uniref:Uncharacterized protein n=1 Tax=Sphingomonas guangdongensis TaxID=1141890 RepID=A0A285R2S4_9SPHN|nr:hypothetical protein [Sphingomonas guangdongensis]SOB86657.1 hypothetical protein SAMN06297144_1765 [Sphingomonas guangdongensis]